MAKSLMITMIASACLLSACTRDKGLDPALQAKPDACDSVRFNSTIRPIVNARCTTSGCHGTGSPDGDLTTYAGLKAKVDNNTFKNRVIDQGDMPQGGPPLGIDTLNEIKCWLTKGAMND